MYTNCNYIYINKHIHQNLDLTILDILCHINHIKQCYIVPYMMTIIISHYSLSDVTINHYHTSYCYGLYIPLYICILYIYIHIDIHVYIYTKLYYVYKIISYYFSYSISFHMLYSIISYYIQYVILDSIKLSYVILYPMILHHIILCQIILY